MSHQSLYGAQRGAWRVCLAQLLGLLALVLTAGAASVELRLSTLVLADDDATLALPRVFLNGIGTHFVTATDALPLLEADSGPLFSSIVVTSDGGVWGSKAMLKAVRAYASKYDVRIVFLNTQKNSTLAGTGAAVWSATTTETYVSFDKATLLANPAMDDVVNETGVWRMSQLSKLQPRPLLVTCDPEVVPAVFMTYGQSPSSQSEVAATAGRTTHGTEEMHFGFNAAYSEICLADDCRDELNFIQGGEDTLLTLSLANVWFTWVTRGVFLGQRRAPLQLHVDDYYSDTDLFSTGKGAGRFRLDSDDIMYTVQWQQNLTARHALPPGSDFRFEMAFNGAHFMADEDKDKKAAAQGKSLNVITMESLGEFNWVSHTWTHQNLDWASEDFCNGKEYTCPLTKERMAVELDYNMRLANGDEVTIDRNIFPDDVYYLDDTPKEAINPIPANRLSKFSLVTPEISGLYPNGYEWNRKTWPSWQSPPRPDNVGLMRLLKKRDITCVVGDNSRPELRAPESRHHPIITGPPAYTHEGLAIVPRNTLSIGYNTHTDRKYLQQYNYQGGSQCYSQPGPACDKSKYTFDEAIGRQVYPALYNLLQFRQDPYMFHQANLHVFQLATTGETTSLLTYFTDRVIDRYLEYVNKMPLTSPKLDDTCNTFTSRLERDQCDASAYVTVVNGRWQSVRVEAQANCIAPALLTVRRCNKLRPAGLWANYHGLDATFELPTAETTNTSYDWTLSSDTFDCLSNDAPLLVTSDKALRTNPLQPETANGRCSAPTVETEETETTHTEEVEETHTEEVEETHTEEVEETRTEEVEKTHTEEVEETGTAPSPSTDPTPDLPTLTVTVTKETHSSVFITTTHYATVTVTETNALETVTTDQ